MSCEITSIFRERAINRLMQIYEIDKSKYDSTRGRIVNALTNKTDDADKRKYYLKVCSILALDKESYVDATLLSKDACYMFPLISFNHNLVAQAHESLLEDKEFMRSVVELDLELLSKPITSLFRNVDFVITIVESFPKCIKYVCDELINNKEFMLKVIKFHPKLVCYVDEETQNSYDFINAAIAVNVDVLEFMALDDSNNMRVCMRASKKNLKYLVHLSDKNKNDFETMMEIARHVGTGVFHYAGDSITTNSSLMCSVLREFGSDAIERLPIKCRTNSLIIRMAIYGMILPEGILGDRTFTYAEIIDVL